MKSKKIEERAKKIKPGRKDEKTLSKKKVPGTTKVAVGEKDLNISERKKAESQREAALEALVKSENRFRSIFESSRDAIMILEPPCWKFTSGNPAAVKMFMAKDEADFASHEPWTMSPERQPDGCASAEKAKEMIEIAMRDGSNFFEWTHKRLNGEEFPATVLLTRMILAEKTILQATVRDITERKRVELQIKAALEALSRSEENFRRSLDDSPLGVRIVTAKGETIYANKVLLDIYGYANAEELNKIPLKERYIPQSYAEFHLRKKAREEGDSGASEYEIAIVRKNKEIRHLQVLRKEVLWNGTKQFQVIYQDITERKQAEAALRESEERFRIAAENASDLIWEWDIVNGKLEWFGTIDAILGYAPGEFPRTIDAWERVIHVDDHDRVMAAIDQHLKTQSPYREEYRVRRKDGTMGYWTDKGVAVCNGQSHPYKMIGVCTDISEQKRAEEALKQANERLLLAIVAGGVGIWDLDVVNNKLTWDDQMFRLYGVAPDKFGGAYETWKAKVHPEDVERGDAEVQMALRGEKEFDTDFRVVWPSGTIHHIRARARVHRDAAGQPTKLIGTNYDITERKRAEEALRISEEKYRLLVENAAEAILIAQNGMLKFVNHMASEMTGYSMQELLSSPFLEFIHPDDRNMVGERYLRRLTGDVSQPRYAFRLVARDGSIKWVEIDAVLVNWEDRPATLNFLSDITERKRAEAQRQAALEALRESEDRYRDLVENSQDLIYTHDLEGKVLSMNEAAVRLTGYPLKDLLSMNMADLLVPGVRHLFKAYMAEIQATGWARGTMRIQTASGEPRYLEYNNTLRTKGVTVPVVRGQAHDITERERAEAEILREKAFLEKLVEAAPEGIAITDCPGRVLRVNSEFVNMFGYEADEAVGKKIDDLLVPPEYLEEAGAITQSVGAGKTNALETVRKRKDGTLLHVSIIGAPIRIRERQVAVYAIYRDISERKRAESQREAALEALRESEGRYQNLAKISPVGIFRTDKNGATTYVNPMWCQISGLSKAKAMGDGWLGAVHSDDRESLSKDWQEKIRLQKPSFADYRFLRPNGTIAWVMGQASPEMNSENQIVGYVGTITDITERKQAEGKIRNSLAEKELLLKEVHHRVKNNLMTIIGLIKMQETKANNEMFNPLLQELEGRVRSMAMVHESLHKSKDLAHVDLQNYIETMSAHIRAQFGAERDIRFRVQAVGVEVDLDIAVSCGLILNELITNAYKHAFPGDKPRAGEGNCEIDVAMEQAGGVFTLTMADNGVGLPSGVDWEKSETLGLRLIKMLSQQINGSIGLDRSTGTTFRLRFAKPSYSDKQISAEK